MVLKGLILSQCQQTSDIRQQTSSSSPVKSHLDLTTDLSGSRRWWLWTFEQASCSDSVSHPTDFLQPRLLVPTRPQMLFARQAGIPTRTSTRQWILSQPCCNAKLTVWFKATATEKFSVRCSLRWLSLGPSDNNTEKNNQLLCRHVFSNRG